jgi:hypothetical protein
LHALSTRIHGAPKRSAPFRRFDDVVVPTIALAAHDALRLFVAVRSVRRDQVALLLASERAGGHFS